MPPNRRGGMRPSARRVARGHLASSNPVGDVNGKTLSLDQIEESVTYEAKPEAKCRRQLHGNRCAARHGLDGPCQFQGAGRRRRRAWHVGARASRPSTHWGSAVRKSGIGEFKIANPGYDGLEQGKRVGFIIAEREVDRRSYPGKRSADDSGRQQIARIKWHQSDADAGC